MSWLVLGGSGFVGSAVLRTLQAAGIDARSAPAPRLSAYARSAEELAAEAHRVDRTALSALIEGYDVVVNAAGLAAPSAPSGPELFGANALLPAVVAMAAADAGASRFIHLSSAAVQGRSRLLDETADTSPFSPYSLSKARGEQTLDVVTAAGRPGLTTVVVRATSVQGTGRPTTASLVRLAQSRLATVASPGTASSPVTSVDALAELVLSLGRFEGALPAVVLQPWEGLTVRSVLEAAGGSPRVLPRMLCRLVIRGGYGVSALLRGRLDGQVRRAELLWFGQEQVRGWATENGMSPTPRVRDVLASTTARH
jgi:nucleoside-diphosphate-sugar epimerase